MPRAAGTPARPGCSHARRAGRVEPPPPRLPAGGPHAARRAQPGSRSAGRQCRHPGGRRPALAGRPAPAACSGRQTALQWPWLRTLSWRSPALDPSSLRTHHCRSWPPPCTAAAGGAAHLCGGAARGGGAARTRLRPGAGLVRGAAAAPAQGQVQAGVQAAGAGGCAQHVARGGRSGEPARRCSQRRAGRSGRSGRARKPRCQAGCAWPCHPLPAAYLPAAPPPLCATPHLQEFVELVRAGQQLEAIAYARRHLAPWAPQYLPELQRAAALLAFQADTRCAPYAALLDDARVRCRGWLATLGAVAWGAAAALAPCCCRCRCCCCRCCCRHRPVTPRPHPLSYPSRADLALRPTRALYLIFSSELSAAPRSGWSWWSCSTKSSTASTRCRPPACCPYTCRRVGAGACAWASVVEAAAGACG